MLRSYRINKTKKNLKGWENIEHKYLGMVLFFFYSVSFIGALCIHVTEHQTFTMVSNVDIEFRFS